MNKEEMIFDESRLANILRDEILNGVKEEQQEHHIDFRPTSFEYISKNNKEYISPIMEMNQDEILDFVERNEIERLAKLTVTELDRISEVLGIEPSVLIEEFE